MDNNIKDILKKLDAIMVVAGDSDYLELKNWVTRDCKKKIIFACLRNHMAWEYKYCWHVYLDDLGESIEYKK